MCVCTSREMVEEVELSSAVSVSSGGSGIRQAFQPPFSRNLFHRLTATPAAMAVRNSDIFPDSLYQFAKTKMGRVTRDSLRIRWNKTGA
jgi:hypothetical protein